MSHDWVEEIKITIESHQQRYQETFSGSDAFDEAVQWMSEKLDWIQENA